MWDLIVSVPGHCLSFYFVRFSTSKTFTLHGTYCVHASMNLRKMEFISYIYTLF